jgi:DNA polymerase III sliding clamp (beta) subunit (PCNA family)
LAGIYGPTTSDAHGLIDAAGNPIAGEFPDYKAVLPASQPNVVFHVSSDSDWLPALKVIARLQKRPFGELAYDGNHLTVSLESTSPAVTAKLTIPVAAGDPKPFKLGINLAYLWEATDAAKRSDERGRWYARIAIIDHITPVTIDNTNGFYSITMPCHCDGGFVTQAGESKQAA